MKSISKINLNIIKEKLYIESLVNEMYNEMAFYGDGEIEAKTLLESIIKEDKGKTIIEDIVEELKLAPKFIFSFGTGIGAFYDPVNKLLSGSGFQMEERQVYLLIITAVAILINESGVDRLITKLKEEGTHSALNSVVEYIENTKTIINSVTENVLKTTYSLSDILAFTSLLVPTMNLMNKIIDDYGLDSKSLKLMLKGVVLSAAVYGVKSIIRRIKQKLD
jgi:hypothetical protein